MPTTPLYTRVDALAFGALGGTTLAVVTPTVNSDRFLFDQDDATYCSVIGGLGTDTSFLTIFTVPDRDEAEPAVGVIPENATITSVALQTKVANGVPTCTDSGFNAFVEVWGMRNAGDFEVQYATLDFTSAFAWSDTDLPLDPQGNAWTTQRLRTGTFYFGLRARTECFASTSPQLKGVNWSEGNLLVAFALPTPTVTTGSVADPNPRGATIYGTVNPNLQYSLTYSAGGTSYPYEVGFTIGAIQNNLPSLVYYGDTVVDLTGDVLVSHVYSGNLSPGTTWYYKVAVRDVDGVVTEGAIRSFTTPLTDVLKGVY